MVETVILPYTPQRTTPKDIARLGVALRQRRSNLRLRTFNNAIVPAWLSEVTLPQTVTVTLNNDRYLPILDYVPGPKFFAPPYEKTKLLAELVKAAIPVPHSATWRDDYKVSEVSFGPYVAIKTSVPGTTRAVGIYVCRTAEFDSLSNQLKEIFARDIAAGHPPTVQQYIPTGPKPTHTRVTTFLGAPIVCFSTEAPDAFELASLKGLAAGEATSNFSENRKRTLTEDPEMLDLARRVCGVFPRAGVLSIDMVRCTDTGRIYCLEANLGNLGVLSSDIVGGLREELGEDAMLRQFNAYETMADRILNVLDTIKAGREARFAKAG